MIQVILIKSIEQVTKIVHLNLKCNQFKITTCNIYININNYSIYNHDISGLSHSNLTS
jgi:hypothetical protein